MNYKSSFIGVCTVFLGMAALGLSGCSISITVPLAEDLVLPGTSSAKELSEVLERGAETDKEILGPISLGQICIFNNMEEFRGNVLALAEDHVSGMPLFLLRFAKIKGALLQKIELTATEGDFSSLTGMTVDIGRTGTAAGVYTAESPEGLDASVNLMAETPQDLLDFLGEDCIEPSLTLEGVLPENDVVFDVLASLTLTYRIGLF